MTGVASLPGTESELQQSEGTVESVLFRLDVRRDDGSAFTCGTVQESASGITRQVEPGLLLDVRVHPTEAKAAADWQRTAERLGRFLTWRRTPVRWVDEDEWPAEGAIEVRWRRADERRLAEQRASWRPVVGVLVDLAPGKEAFDKGRSQLTVSVEVKGRTVAVLEAVPDLAAARLQEVRVEPDRKVLAVRRGVPLACLTDGRDVVVDWEATLRRPEFRGLEGIEAT